MNAHPRPLLIALLASLLLIAGCRADSGPRAAAKIAVGSKVRNCDIVFDGPGPPDWRKHSLSVGPYGLPGTTGPDFDASSERGGLLTVKTPTIVAGHRPVTISVPAEERARVGILGVHPRPAFASVTYVPCKDKPRTVFAAGFLMRSKKPVDIGVQVGEGPVRTLHLPG